MRTLRLDQMEVEHKAHQVPPYRDLMDTVYLNGELKRFQTMDEIRELTLTPIWG